jgi:PTH1 family peptidyl-tRNA hydrolase
MGSQIKYVLGEWTSEEKNILFPKIETSVEIIKSFGTIGIDRTMTAFNNK